MSVRTTDSLLRRAAWTAYAALDAPRQRRAPYRSPQAIERAQSRRVRRAVRHAHRHVPYYRETFRRLGLGPGDFAGARDLARLPLIEREQLQRDPEYFVSRSQPLKRCVALATDGTAGRPVVVYHDPFALFQGIGHARRQEAVVRRLTRRRGRLRRVRIGLPMSTPERTSAALRRRSLVPAGLLYRDLELSMLDPPAAQLPAIASFDGDLLESYGSYVEALFVAAHRVGAPPRLPPVAAYLSDALSEPVRRLMVDRFGVHPLSWYGAAEAHNLGFECGRHTGIHLNCDLYPLRIVDADGQERSDGQSGDVVISNLVNRATVLLNYRLGDLATRLESPCPCGRALPLLSLPEGRSDDWVQAGSGEVVHPQEVRGLLLADDTWLLAFQIVQLARSRFAVCAVVDARCDRARFAAGVKERFAARMGPGTVTEVEFADQLPRTRGGKVRTLVAGDAGDSGALAGAAGAQAARSSAS